MAVVYRRVLRGAPAYATCRHGGTAIGGHIAAACSSGGHDIANRIGCHGGSRVRSGETALFPIPCARTVGGIGTDKIGGAGIQTCQIAGKAAHAATVSGMAVAHLRVLRSAPAHTARRHVSAAGGRHITAADGGQSSDVTNCIGCQSGRDGQRGKAALRAISCAYTISGIGPHIVGGAWCQTCNTTGKASRPATIGRVAVVYRRVLRSAPAHAASRHGGTAGSRHIAATGGRGGRDIINRIGCYRRCRVRSGETTLFPIRRTRTVGSIGPHIVGGTGIQPCQIAGEAAHSATVSGVATAHRRVLRSAPAYTARGHGGTTGGRHIATASCRRGHDIVDRIGCHGG